MNDSSESLTGFFLMAHGAPESVDDISEYLKNIRGGTESTPETIQIIRDRYEQIGGSSPLREISVNCAFSWKIFSTRKVQNSKSNV